MQKLETQTLRFYQPTKPILKPDKPIPLKKLLSSSDMQQVAEKRLYWISIKTHDQTVFASLDQTVSQRLTTINRDRRNQLIGLPLVVGG